MPSSIDSVVLVVRDLEKATETFSRSFGLRFGARHVVEEKQTVTAWADFGSVSLQLIAPTGDESPLLPFLDERGEGLYALTVGVDDLEAAREELIPVGLVPPGAEVIDTGYAKEIVLRPSQTHGALFVLRHPGT